MSIDYHEYIKSDAWRKRAMSAKRRAKWRCQVCNEKGKHATLNAHHRTYERLGNEWPTDLVVLCPSCHALFHTSMTDPKTGERQARWIGIFRELGIPKNWGDVWDYARDEARCIECQQKVALVAYGPNGSGRKEFVFALKVLGTWIGRSRWNGMD